MRIRVIVNRVVDKTLAEMVSVPISKRDRGLGLRFHFIRKGVKIKKAKRCRTCTTLLDPEHKTNLCDMCGRRGFRRPL